MSISLHFIRNDPLESLVVDAKSGRPRYQVTTQVGGRHPKTFLLAVETLSKSEYIPGNTLAEVRWKSWCNSEVHVAGRPSSPLNQFLRRDPSIADTYVVGSVAVLWM